MANRETHVAVGTVCGAGLAYYGSDSRSSADRLLEGVGGLLGGWVGARLADLIDVPTSPWHRDHAHSIVAGVVIVSKAKEMHLAWERSLRHHLQDVRLRKANAATDWDRMWLGFMEVLLQIAIGVVSGLIAGHLSHLALDFRTAGRLPLV